MALTNAERQKRYRERKKATAKPKPKPASAPTSAWTGVDEIIEFLAALPRVQVGVNNYTEKDRAADFIATFSTDAGRRVLTQIALICDPPTTIADADKNGSLAWKGGMRRVMAEIQRCFVVREAPTKGEPDDG